MSDSRIWVPCPTCGMEIGVPIEKDWIECPVCAGLTGEALKDALENGMPDES